MSAKEQLARLQGKAAHLGWVLVEYAISYAYIKLVAPANDRIAFREMEVMLGRPLSIPEKKGILAMRIGTEVGAREALRRAREARSGGESADGGTKP